MTALFTIWTNDGRRSACDEPCYNAYDAHCSCVCGGRNHGLGIQRAAQQTARFLPQWVQDLASGSLKRLAPIAVAHHSLNALAFPQLARLDDTAAWRSHG